MKYPDDGENHFYLRFDTSLPSIIEKCKEKWGDDIDLDLINISSEYHQIDCFGHDLYDPSDYASFVVVEYEKPK
ncbi:hypothetical protein phiOC_p291 [Ochrobactrum phage vB_OspM_OC]|nr:hypothetical protein phiOC_p291 [Ochrobactrum phage vB_OspM_OC]